MVISRTALLSLMLFLSIEVFAGGGSNYTIFGIGDIRMSGTVRSSAMGYTGIAVMQTGGINLNAPATWSTLANTRIEAGLLYEGFDASDGTKSLYLARADFTGGSIAIPIAPGQGVVFVGGFTSYSNKDFSVFTTGSQQGIDYTLNQTGSGGIGRALAGLSYAPVSSLAFGASFNYLFGSLESSRTLTPSSPLYAGGTTTTTLSANGITTTFSALFSGFGPIIPTLEPLALGFAITSRGVLDTEETTVYQFVSEIDSSETIAGEIVIPLAFGFGASYRAGARWLFAADFTSQLWSHGSFKGQSRNSTLFGFGIERLPLREIGARWIDKIAYRLGFYHNAISYVVNGRTINEWGITGGFGIPISGENKVNLALEYGRRGETSNSLIEERIIRVSLSLFLGETWFVRFEEE
jgi:hypothetical protein